MGVDQVVGTILIRDHHRYVRYHYLLRIVLIVTALLVLSLWANVSLAERPPVFRYVLTDVTGKLMTPKPLDDPWLTDEQVISWAVDATTRIYTIDFLNYREQLQDAQERLTVGGWKGFEKALKESGNFTAIVKNRFATTAAPTGPGQITRRGLAPVGDGTFRYSWEIEFPLMLTYRSYSASTTQALNMKIVVARMPEYIFSSGVGIRSINAR